MNIPKNPYFKYPSYIIKLYQEFYGLSIECDTSFFSKDGTKKNLVRTQTYIRNK